MKDIKIWHIGNGRYYAKVPYERKEIMGKKFAKMTYRKNGKLVFLQFELNKREAELLMSFGTLIPQKSKNKKQFQKAV